MGDGYFVPPFGVYPKESLDDYTDLIDDVKSYRKTPGEKNIFINRISKKLKRLYLDKIVPKV